VPGPAYACAIGLAVGLFATPVYAGSVSAQSARFEVFSGSGLTSNSSFNYAGGVWALGHAVSSPGFRIKALGGFGDYVYDGSVPLSGGIIPARFNGDVLLGELLAGRLWGRGEWTLKTYAGIEYARHDISPDDPSNQVQGSKWGGKLQLETWRNLGTASFFSLDASYGSAFGDYWVQARLGRRVAKKLTVGLEAGGLGNEAYDAGRGGAFLRFHLDSMDFTLSGGVTGDYLNDETGGYVSFGMYRKL